MFDGQVLSPLCKYTEKQDIVLHVSQLSKNDWSETKQLFKTPEVNLLYVL